MVELVDTLVSGTSAVTGMEVQVFFRAVKVITPMKRGYKHGWAISFLLFLAFSMLIVSSCAPSKQQKYITIGALLPLTGPDSDEGIRAFNGLQLAKTDINENGGILGKKLDIIVLNDRGDEEYIAQQYQVLKERGVVAIIGSSYSYVTIALAKAVQKDGIPIISPTASNPEVTRDRKNVFRAIFIDDYQAEVMAYFAYHSLNAKTAVVLINENSIDYRHTAGVFAMTFQDYGGHIMALESFWNTNDFANILNKYTANPPDLIYCPEDYGPAAKLVNTAHGVGLNSTHMLGSDAWDGLLTYVQHPDAMNNVYYSAPFLFDDQDAEAIKFVQKYFNSFSQMPLSGSATAYTCVYILAEAIKKAGNTDKNDIISAMKENELDMITGQIKFDDKNNPHTNVHIIQIKGGIYSTYEKLSL